MITEKSRDEICGYEVDGQICRFRFIPNRDQTNFTEEMAKLIAFMLEVISFFSPSKINCIFLYETLI